MDAIERADDAASRIERMHKRVRAEESFLCRKLTQAEVDAIAEECGSLSFDYSGASGIVAPIKAKA